MVWLGSTVHGPWMSVELGQEYQFCKQARQQLLHSRMLLELLCSWYSKQGRSSRAAVLSGSELCLEPVYSALGNFILSSNKLLPECSDQCGLFSTKEPHLRPHFWTGVQRVHPRALLGECIFLTSLTPFPCSVDEHWPLTHFDAFKMTSKLLLQQTHITMLFNLEYVPNFS